MAKSDRKNSKWFLRLWEVDTNCGEIKIPVDGEVQGEGRAWFWRVQNGWEFTFSMSSGGLNWKWGTIHFPRKLKVFKHHSFTLPSSQSSPGTEQGSSEQLNTKYRQQLSFINNKNSTYSPCPGWFNPEYIHAWAVPTGKETTITKPNTEQTKKAVQKNTNTTQLPLQLPKNLRGITFGRGSSWQGSGSCRKWDLSGIQYSG